MKISVTRTGGFAGVTDELGSVDTAQLDAAARQKLEQAVRRMKFFELPARLPSEPVGADLFAYRVTVRDGPREHSVTFTGEEGAAATLRELLEAMDGSKS